MIYRNRANPAIEVEVLHPEAELRLAETKRQAIVYRRISTGTIHIRPKAEFLSKFAPVEEK
jgi:hypothetical protein